MTPEMINAVAAVVAAVISAGGVGALFLVAQKSANTRLSEQLREDILQRIEAIEDHQHDSDDHRIALEGYVVKVDKRMVAVETKCGINHPRRFASESGT